jgi:murein DD-endopeptidase MepM/ murein hydrolase activator NlpD
MRSGAYVALGPGAGGGSGGELLARLAKWTKRVFAERQILVRAEGRVSYITLSRRSQALMAVGGIAGLALVAYMLSGPLIGWRGRTAAPADAGLAADAQLRARIDQLQRQLAAANAQLSHADAAQAPSNPAIDKAQARIKALEEARDHAIAEQQELQRQLSAAQDAARAKTQSLAQLSRTLDANRGELRQYDTQRSSLQNRVRQLESELDAAKGRTNQYKADLESIERKLQQLAAEHDKTVAERDRLQARLSELQGRGAAKAAPDASDSTAAAPPMPAPPRAQADHPADQRSDNAGEVEQLIASTGIDVEKLLSRLGSVPAGQGGPYVALDKVKPLGVPDARRSEELQRIIKTLPLSSPLVQYTVGSGFGGRPDPFNKHQAFHTGVDLVAPYRTAVHSTAAGTVIFTGVKQGYGKVVEVDHGHGIVTRYAHLHRIVVARGQKVQLNQRVGEVGSTGRSTGPHLHYEVLVDGTPQDPEKFMQAGKNVVQASGQ